MAIHFNLLTRIVFAVSSAVAYQQPRGNDGLSYWPRFQLELYDVEAGPRCWIKKTLRHQILSTWRETNKWLKLRAIKQTIEHLRWSTNKKMAMKITPTVLSWKGESHLLVINYPTIAFLVWQIWSICLEIWSMYFYLHSFVHVFIRV